jgi:hypothetical protein
MPAFKAKVRQGRIVLDEPTNLPEGAEVRLLEKWSRVVDQKSDQAATFAS